MGNFHTLAWRNLWRHPRRTLLTALGVTIASAILIFFMSIQFSSYDTAIRATTALFQGHLQVQAPGYLDKPQINTVIDDIHQVQSRSSTVNGVAGAAARAIGFALISGTERTLSAQVVGVEPSNEGKISTIPGLVRQGRFLEDADRESIVIGSALARNLHAEVGSELTLLGQGRGGAMAAAVLTVVGTFESGSRDFDRGLAYIPLPYFQEVFSMESSGHTVVIAAKSISEIPEIQVDLKENFTGIVPTPPEVLSWEQVNPGLRQSIDLDMAFGWLFYLCLLVIVTFGVLNTFLMTIMERTREFGLLMALGMTPGRVISLIVCECGFLVMCGLVPGVLIGALLIWYFHQHGFYIPGSEDILRMWNIHGAVYPELSAASLTQGPLVIVVFSLLVVLLSSWRLRRLDAVEAMRNV